MKTTINRSGNAQDSTEGSAYPNRTSPVQLRHVYADRRYFHIAALGALATKLLASAEAG